MCENSIAIKTRSKPSNKRLNIKTVLCPDIDSRQENPRSSPRRSGYLTLPKASPGRKRSLHRLHVGLLSKYLPSESADLLSTVRFGALVRVTRTSRHPPARPWLSLTLPRLPSAF